MGIFPHLLGSPVNTAAFVQFDAATYNYVLHEYNSLDEMRGCMSLARCPDPAAYERANYIKVLHSWPGYGR